METIQENNMLIKQEMNDCVEKYKKGSSIEKQRVNKIQDKMNNISCFFCLDTKQMWSYRSPEHNQDGKGFYYRQTCNICPSESVRNKWIDDSETYNMISPFGIKIFRVDTFSGSERFFALDECVKKEHPELSANPEYGLNRHGQIVKKIKKKQLTIEVGNIMNECIDIFRAFNGDISAYSNILRNIKTKISSLDETCNEKMELSEEMENNYFTFALIKNNTTVKEKSILGLGSYSSYTFNISIDIYQVQTKNKSASYRCSEIINNRANKNLEEIVNIFT